jgi:hypothetical protein
MELQRAERHALTPCADLKRQNFLLIDALDECDPQDRLGDLADVILWLSRFPNVKLCVSCRPWAAFTRRFDKATVLHLDQLTYHDMEVYIEKRLLSAEAEAELCSDFHDGTIPAKRLIRCCICCKWRIPLCRACSEYAMQ